MRMISEMEAATSISVIMTEYRLSGTHQNLISGREVCRMEDSTTKFSIMAMDIPQDRLSIGLEVERQAPKC